MQQQLVVELSPSPQLLSNLYQVHIVPVPDLPLGGQCVHRFSLGTVSVRGLGGSLTPPAESQVVPFVSLWISLSSGKWTSVQRPQGSYGFPKWPGTTAVLSSPCKDLCFETELEGCWYSQPRHCQLDRSWMISLGWECRVSLGASGLTLAAGKEEK